MNITSVFGYGWRILHRYLCSRVGYFFHNMYFTTFQLTLRFGVCCVISLSTCGAKIAVNGSYASKPANAQVRLQ